jgi:hypothetical protein
MTDTVASFSVVWDGDKATFAKAFVTAQKGMESVKKAATNPAFKTKYADLSEVVEAVVPALNAAGIGVMQFPAFTGDMVSVTTVFLHESGASVTGTLDLRPPKSDPQGIGSAVTYGRRYSLLAMTGAAPEDDDGNASSGPRQDYRRDESPRRSPAVVAAESALVMCQSAEDVAGWEAKNKAVLETMSKEDRATVLAAHKATKAKFAAPADDMRAAVSDLEFA